MELEMKISSEDVSAKLLDLPKTWPGQHEGLYVLAQHMVPTLKEKPTVDPFDFVGAAALACFEADDYLKAQGKGLPDLIDGKRVLDYTPDIARQTCPQDFAEQVKAAYKELGE